MYNSVIIFLFQMTLLTWLIFQLISLTDTLTTLLFLIYLFLTLVFVLQWAFLHSEILMWFSQFPLIFHQTRNRMPRFIA